jgi:hypothetical protein
MTRLPLFIVRYWRRNNGPALGKFPVFEDLNAGIMLAIERRVISRAARL